MVSAEIIACSSTQEVLKKLLNQLKQDGQSGLKDLARLAGLKSPASISMVLNGQRRLSIETAERLASALKLPSRAARFFLLLVRKDLTTVPEERLVLEEKLLYLRTRRESHALNLGQYRFLGVWYYPTIYALAGSGTLVFDAKAIAGRLGRKVTPAMVRAAVGDLINLKLLTLNGNMLNQAQGPVCTNEAIKHLAVKRYHQEMIRLALESVEKPVNERELCGLTIQVPANRVSEVKRRMQEFRAEMATLLAGAESGEVHQLNLQFFPLTSGGVSSSED